MVIVPLINSRKSVKKQNIIRLNKNFWFNLDFIPSEWIKEDLIKMLNMRMEIEQKFSHNMVVYHVR
ncbi:MAG: hypothetical protein ACTSVV_18200 [Promethearchaeota archaeon]